MKNKIIRVYTATVFTLVGTFGLHAQTTIPANEAFVSAGGDSNNNTGSVAFSMGGPFDSFNSVADGSVEVGIQHGYDVFTINVDNNELGIFLKVYPNPTIDFLTLEVKEEFVNQLQFSLIGGNGETLDQGDVNEKKSKLDLTKLASGFYFLNIIDTDKREVINFKIIKQ